MQVDSVQWIASKNQLADGLTIMIHDSVWPQDHLQPMVTKDILLPSVQSTSKATHLASLVVEQELLPWYGVHGSAS